MNKKLKHDGRPKRSICEQSAYTSNLIIYTKYSDIGVIRHTIIKGGGNDVVL